MRNSLVSRYYLLEPTYLYTEFDTEIYIYTVQLVIDDLKFFFSAMMQQNV